MADPADAMQRVTSSLSPALVSSHRSGQTSNRGSNDYSAQAMPHRREKPSHKKRIKKDAL